MIDINPMNFLTIGIISIGAYALVRFGLKAAGMSPSLIS